MKRAFDVTLAALGLVVLSPVMLAVALGVLVWVGRPVLFSQERAGLGGRSFRIHKFRTMTELQAGDGRLLPDAERLTRFGRALRGTSLDELPQLWNVLRGDMSLIGPRPLLMEYLPLYNAFEARRHEVRPGITGWAQVHGRNAVTWQERFALDVHYVEHQSLGLDARILAMTFLKVLRREGISQAGAATMGRFTGHHG